MGKQIAVIGAAALAAVALAGCGGGNHDVSVVPRESSVFATGNRIGLEAPAKIIDTAEATFRAASSVRVRSIDPKQPGRVVADVVMTRRGATGWGLYNGRKVNFVLVGGRLYLRSRAYWSGLDPTIGRVIGDGWAAMPSDASPLLTGYEHSIGQFADQMLAPIGSDPGPTIKGKRMVTVGGRPAVLVSLYDLDYQVAATGKPFPLRFASGGDGPDLEFSGYDRPVTITAPRGAIDLDKPLDVPAKG